MSAFLNKKHLLLGTAGVAAFAAASWLGQWGDSEVAVVQAVSRDSNAGKAAKPAKPASPGLTPRTLPPSTLQTPARSLVAFENEKDIFSPHSWLPPPPPPPPPQIAAPAPPPPPPMAPPLPFSFFGSLDEKGLARRVFLTKGDQLVIVKANDVVEGQYRIDRISESAVDLTYLPLNQKQSISIQQGGL
jgi:hypothetical protein